MIVDIEAKCGGESRRQSVEAETVRDATAKFMRRVWVSRWLADLYSFYSGVENREIPPMQLTVITVQEAK